MSFFTSFKTFVEKFSAEMLSLFKKAPTFEQNAVAFVKFAAPLAEGILQMVDPPAVPAATAIITTVQTDLGVIQSVTTGISQPSASLTTSVVNSLNSIKLNLPGLLQVAEVKNSVKVNEVEGVVTTIVGEVEALLSSVPTAA